MNLRLFTAAALFLGSCGLVQADSIVYDVKYGPTMVGGVEVKSEALITLTNGHIAVTLINQEPGLKTVGQAITGFVMNFGSSSLTLIGTNGNFAAKATTAEVVTKVIGTDAKGKDITATVFDNFLSNQTISGPTNWVSELTSSSVRFDAFGKAQPQFSILSTDVSTNAAGSIADNTSHNPFAYGQATFSYDVGGLNLSLAAFNNGDFLKSVKFQYNTASTGGFTDPIPVTGTYDHPIGGTGGGNQNPPVPEPSSFALLGIGAAFTRWMHRRKSTTA